MKRVIIVLALVLLSSIACQHPSLNQGAAQPANPAAATTLSLSAPYGR
jgi:hypothetical protein